MAVAAGSSMTPLTRLIRFGLLGVAYTNLLSAEAIALAGVEIATNRVVMQAGGILGLTLSPFFRPKIHGVLREGAALALLYYSPWQASSFLTGFFGASLAIDAVKGALSKLASLRLCRKKEIVAPASAVIVLTTKKTAVLPTEVSSVALPLAQLPPPPVKPVMKDASTQTIISPIRVELAKVPTTTSSSAQTDPAPLPAAPAQLPAQVPAALSPQNSIINGVSSCTLSKSGPKPEPQSNPSLPRLQPLQQLLKSLLPTK